MDSSAYILEADSPSNSQRSSVHSCMNDIKKSSKDIYNNYDSEDEYNNSNDNVNIIINAEEIFVNKFMFHKIQALDIIEDK